jgi:uncharacterized protein YutE (UPF0331/DUF86 family)
LILVLHLLKLIDQNTFTKMSEVNSKRNAIVHSGLRKGEIERLFDRNQQEDIINTLKNAKFCIDKLKKAAIEQVKSKKSLPI